MRTLSAAPTGWAAFEPGFLDCHRRRSNVEAHLITTPLGLFGAVWLVAGLSPAVAAALVAAYVGFLLMRVPPGPALVSAAASVGMLAAAASLDPRPWVAIAAIAAAWVGQELAHRAAGEETFQSSYQGGPAFLGKLATHTLFLLPLVVAASVEGPLPFLSRLVPRRGATFARLRGERLAKASVRLRAWVEASLPSTDQTTHVWRHALPPEARADFEAIADDPQLIALVRRHHGPGWDVAGVAAMDEVYVTGPEKALTSDTVFYLPHIDGPWTVFPGAALYRTMVAISPNRRITTHFPMGGDAVTLDDGEAVAFDFNRELHYITCDLDQPQPGLRINLKLHHVAFPRGLGPWGRLLATLTARYNVRARALFLFTLAPESAWEKVGAAYVVANTRLFAALQRYVGAGNLSYTAVVAAIALGLGDATPWVLGVSFVHYLKYIAVFRDRTDVAFGAFVRDAVFFKVLSFATLAACSLAVFRFEPVSIALIAGGFGLSAVAAFALGRDRTYFGVELGLVPAERITTFPYGVVPHPMIVGSLIGLAGVYALPEQRAAWPWLVPAHMALYALHLLQEATDTRPAEPRAGLAG